MEKSQQQQQLEQKPAARPASSPVENKNKPTRRNTARIEPFRRKHLDPETLARTSKAVTQAICEFYAQGHTSMPLEQLYRDVYNMVLHKKGGELYSLTEAAMTSEVQSLCRTLEAAPADGVAFLKEMLAKWNQHTRALNMTLDILMYLDRTYVPTNRKTSVRELGLRLWRDQVTRAEIRERLIEAVKRRGGGEDDELVAGVKKVLTELGKDVPGLFFPDGQLHVAAGP